MVLKRLFGGARKTRPYYFSACNLKSGDQGYGAAGLDADGGILWRTAMPARGHSIVLSDDGSLAAMVDRKPGKAIALCEPETGKLKHRFAAAPGHTFDGHAVFSSDGGKLYATESADGGQQGRIAIFSVSEVTRIGECSSHGIEPHELIWLEPDRLLAIGNGGIRDKLAMEAEIESSLVILDAGTGAAQSRSVLDEDLISLSIRHLALTATGEILFAMQDQDAATDWRPMAGLLTKAGKIEFLDMPIEALTRLRGYCGSAAVDSSSAYAAVTSPHGGVAAFWHIPNRRFLGLAELRDGCGIAAAPNAGGFAFTAGSGTRLLVAASESGVTSRILERPTDPFPQWDNHLTAYRPQ
ncbi:MAG TPA: DUF1513 domain-containing protein [Dongiaceae bacterium]